MSVSLKPLFMTVPGWPQSRLFGRAATHQLEMVLLSLIQPKRIPVNTVCSDTTLSPASATLSKPSLYLHGCNGYIPEAGNFPVHSVPLLW